MMEFFMFAILFVSIPFDIAVRKKVHSLAKVKECEAVGQWEQSINNHVYWVASSTKDDEQEMRVAKWKSLENHLQGKHSGHSELFPRCLHGDLGTKRRKKYLKPSKYRVFL